MHDLVVERADHVVQLAARRPDVLHLALEELVPFCECRELFEGQRVDRSQLGQLRLELGHPGASVHPGGKFGLGRRQGLFGCAPELAPQHIDHRFASDTGLGQLELNFLEPAADSRQLVLRG